MSTLREALRASLNLIEDGPFAGLERNGYAAIVADPPWFFRSRTALQSANWSSRRDAEKHYNVMNIKAIEALPVKELARKEGCHLFLWTTGPCLEMAFKVIKRWGFRYSSIGFTWVKLKRADETNGQFTLVPTLSESMLHVGLGLTTRKNAEFCLLARRGNPKRLSKKVREIILSPVREHSRKPDEMRARVMEYCAGPYLELFARQQHDGWTSWGFERNKFKTFKDGGTDARTEAEGAEARG